VTRSRREPRTVLEHMIQQRDRTYEELADEFAKLDEQATISARHLGRLARGERGMAGTNPATRRALQAMFAAPAEDLLKPWSPGNLAVPHSGADHERNVVDAEHDRSIITVAAERARRFTLEASQGTTPEFVDQLHSDVQRLAIAYPQRPITELLGDLVETQDTLFTLLERRETPNQARQLHFLAAVTSGLLAKASHDLTEPHPAMIQARTAVLCADQADHRGLRAWLRGLQSLVAYWAGRYHEALHYAEQGSEYAVGSSGTASVWLPLSAARASAALGNAERAIQEIQRAEEAWEHVTADDVDQLGGICVFNRPRTLYYAADALAWLPEHASIAADYSSKAVVAFSDPGDPAWAFGDQAGAHANLAIARIAGRDLEGAAEAFAPVLELPPEQRINGVVQSVQRVQAAIVRAGLAEDARPLIEAMEEFTRTALRSLRR
jgi:tetratricopeptide (TPR) repeat protein